MPCSYPTTRRKGESKGTRTPCGEKGKNYQVSGLAFCAVMCLCHRHTIVMSRNYTLTLTIEQAGAGAEMLPEGTLTGVQEKLL